VPAGGLVPPYYAVIFSSQLNGKEEAGYAAMAETMVRLAAQQPGFLGMDSVRDTEGMGITVSYWQTEKDVQGWRENAEHQVAQKKGRETWYTEFQVHIARVERTYGKTGD